MHSEPHPFSPPFSSASVGSALSMLDLVSVREGGSVRQALDIALGTAQHAEKLGFVRYWMAEHHNMEGIASSATAVLIGGLRWREKSDRLITARKSAGP